MKNFKKIIALVLVVAMIASFATMTSATFTDAADISYEEAVDVMVGLGVINGYEDGSFNPDGSVTRAEMAKMVAFIMNSGDDINDEYADQNIFTDCGNWHWASGYIAFCYNAGIIDGRGDGTFDPDATVTGQEGAKMLLIALGYKSAEEGYTGTSWASEVITDARTAELNDDMSGFSWSAAMTRDEAAMMMFNALQATMVEYLTSGSSVTTGDTTITIGGSGASKREYTTDNYDQEEDGDEDGYLQLCEEYLEDLLLYSADEDLLGRPSHTWEYDGDTIGTYADEADYTLFADDNYSAGDLLDFIQDEGDDDLEYPDDKNDIEIWLNGDEEDEDVVLYVGDIVEIYEEDDEMYSIVVIRYVYDTIDDIDDDDDDMEDYEITFDDDYTMIEEDSMNFAKFYAVAEVDMDVVLVANSAGDVILAEVPTTVTGSITSVSTSSYYVKLDGTTYYYCYDADTPEVTEDDEEATLYFNSYGYAVYCDYTDDSNDDNMIAVLKTYSALNSDSEIVNMAKVVFSDGTTGDIEYDDVLAKVSDTPTSTSKAPEVGTIYMYAEDDDVYTLYTMDCWSASDTGSSFVRYDNVKKGADVFDTSSRYYWNDSVSGMDKDTDSIYYDSDVLFIFIDEDDNDVTVYSGVTDYTAEANQEIGFALNEDKDRIIAVFVSGAADGETADEVIYLDSYTGKTYVNGETYYTYDAYLEGKIIDDFYADNDSLAGCFVEYSIGDDGEYEIDKAVVADGTWDDDDEYVYETGLTIAETVDEAYITFSGASASSAASANDALGTDDLKFDSAKIVDLVDDYYKTAARLEKLVASGCTVTVAVIADLDAGEVEVIYITGIYEKSSDVSLTSITFAGVTATTLYTSAEDAQANANELGSDVTATNYTATCAGAASTSKAVVNTDSLTVNSGDAIAQTISVTVTAENGDTATYYAYFTGTGASSGG